jgi:hypothetical protein
VIFVRSLALIFRSPETTTIMAETSTEFSAAAFDESIRSVSTNKNNTTIIELSAFENAHTKCPPTVTGTVYEIQMLPEDPPAGFDENSDSFCIVGDELLLECPDDSLDPLFCVDKCLMKKVAEILQENAWLASRIVRSPKQQHNSKSKSNKLPWVGIESKVKRTSPWNSRPSSRKTRPRNCRRTLSGL